MRETGNSAAPAVVAQRLHRDRCPLGNFIETKQQACCDVIVPIGKYVCLHFHGVADNALNGIAARVDLRLDALDDDAFPSIRGLLHSSDQALLRGSSRAHSK